MMNFDISIILAASFLSAIALVISMITLVQTKNRNNGFKVKVGDLISPQREYVESLVYNSTLPLTKDYGFLADASHILFSSEGKEMIIRTKLPDFSFFEDMGIFLPEVKVKEKMVMCLMPFHKKFDKTKIAIAESCTKAGYRFRRSDDELLADNTDLRKNIVRMILEAQIIVAVLDGRNPNVFYEIGIAHSMGKLVLMVVNLNREENKHQEVDLLSNRLITYNNINELKAKLEKTLKAIHYDERREEKTNN